MIAKINELLQEVEALKAANAVCRKNSCRLIHK